MPPSPTITLHLPDGDVHITPKDDEREMPLSQLFRRHNLPLNTRCGQQGLCDSCRITLNHGQLRQVNSDELIIADQPQPIQACQYRHTGSEPLELTVPERAITRYQPQVLDAFKLNVARAHDPLWPPRPDDAWYDADDAQPPAAGNPLGIAIDIGTTTVAILLVDLTHGDVLARASDFNQQMHLGDDVLTRINLCLNDKSLIDKFQEAIVNETLSPLIDQTLEQAQQRHEQVVALVAAGNTTMLHLLDAVDPSSMGLAPFTPVFLEHTVKTLRQLDYRPAAQDQARSAQAKARKHANLHMLPSAAAYIGADLTAGIVASNMRFARGTALLVDVGTNGEIVLKHGDKLYGCATAAGPAFEGSKLTDGIRAGHGAISHIFIDPQTLDISYEVIGHEGVFDDKRKPTTPPIGLCGSAYVDFLAEARRAGLLLEAGRYNAERLEQIKARRMQSGLSKCHGPCFRIAYGQGKEPIVISEADIALQLQAKAAIAAGIVVLLERLGQTTGDVETLYLAGGFGMHMRLESAVGSGLLPGFHVDQIELVGNTSLAGAYMALLDRHAIDEMAAAARDMSIIELNLEPTFQDRFIDHLMLG